MLLSPSFNARIMALISYVYKLLQVALWLPVFVKNYNEYIGFYNTCLGGSQNHLQSQAVEHEYVNNSAST